MTRPPERTSVLTVDDRARELNVSRAFAYRLIQQREIPSYSIGRCVRVKERDMARYLEKAR